MSMVVLDSKTWAHKWRKERATCLQKTGTGRPRPTSPGGCVPLPGSVFFQHDHLPFVTFVPACSTCCTTQTLSSTPLLALLVLALDALALSHVHAPLLHLLHMPPWISCKVMLSAHPCLSFACGLDESYWKGIQWCIKVQAWLTQLDCLPISMSYG
jgi:hypothetical protein